MTEQDNSMELKVVEDLAYKNMKPEKKAEVDTINYAMNMLVVLRDNFKLNPIQIQNVLTYLSTVRQPQHLRALYAYIDDVDASEEGAKIPKELKK